MSTNVPFLNFQPAHAPIKQEMMQAFEAVYDSGWFINGNSLAAFEAAYAAFNDVPFAVGVSNGLDALFLSLKALDIGAGDEVIVPSNTYIATALAVSHVGATPVFAEPDPRTYNICPQNIETAISARTKAIMPVHLYGQACEMDKIIEIAHRYGLSVVEDNAQAHGAAFNGKLTGSWGVVNGTSFYPGKNLGALGDGGAVTTNDEAIAEKVRLLRNYGSARKYYNEIPGYNMRLDECQAAFLSVKLKHLARWTAERQQIAAWYTGGLQGLSELVLPQVHEQATHVYHLYVIHTGRRDELAAYLLQKNIGTLIHYPVPPHLQQAYTTLGYKKGDFPLAEHLAATCLSLPIWPGMNKELTTIVINAIKQFFYA